MSWGNGARGSGDGRSSGGRQMSEEGSTFNPETATVQSALERMRYIVRHSGYEDNGTSDPDVYETGDGQTYGNERITIVARKWENYGKSRTYLTVYEERLKTNRGRKFWRGHAEHDYGYIDNKTGRYVPGRKDLTNDYDLGGNKI